MARGRDNWTTRAKRERERDRGRPRDLLAVRARAIEDQLDFSKLRAHSRCPLLFHDPSRRRFSPRLIRAYFVLRGSQSETRETGDAEIGELDNDIYNWLGRRRACN